jgi:hypothetical protein
MPEVCDMNVTFGARLRLQRERQDVALTAIAEETKISVPLLEALERDDVSRWPGGVFRRAYVRAYAQAIGLQPEAVLQEFLERYPEPMEENAQVLALAQGVTDGPSSRIGFLMKSAVAGAAGLLSQLRTHRETGRTSRTPEVPVTPLPVPREAGPSHDPSVNETEVKSSADTHEHRRRQRSLPPARRRTIVAEGERVSIERETYALSRALRSFARLCTTLGCAHDTSVITSALADAAKLLEAQGLTLWLWDARRARLCAVLTHGYSQESVARWPRVGRNTDNAIAAAFRSGQVRAVTGTAGHSGTFVAPLLTSMGCTGVLALEFASGGEPPESAQALATILSAQLSTLVLGVPVDKAVSA